MDSLEHDYPDAVLAPRQPPCLSLYQPTHRSHPENAQDPIRFRNLVKALLQSLRQEHPERECRSVVDPLHALADDVQFWNHAFVGLAVLSAAGFFRLYRLQRPVPELAVVADSFHTKPLIRIMQSADRFRVLGINRHRARLFEGNRDRLDEVGLPPGVPDSLDDALQRDFGRDRDIRTYGPTREAGKIGRHGKSDVRQVAIDADTAQFFRIVDRGLLEAQSRPRELDAGRQVRGHMDPATGAIAPGNPGGPHADDLLDDLGERVLRTGGEVVIVPGERMPTDTGLAAVYRF